MSDILRLSRDGRVAHVALNRPDKRNALSAALCHELVKTLEEADHDPGAGAILLTANGKAFCAGMDLDEIGIAGSEAINQAHEQLFTIGARVSTPIVAAVRGPALGGGMGLAANCHIVVAAEDASFGLTEIRLGLWPFLIFRAVAEAIGERRSIELALTGRTFGGREAVELGLAHEVAAEPEARAAEIAFAVAESSPTAVRSGMTFVQQARGRDWHSAGQLALHIRNYVFGSPDFEEGIRAFREKRRPKWPSLGE